MSASSQDERVTCDRCQGDGITRYASAIYECTKCGGWGTIVRAYLDQKAESQQNGDKS
jgi:ribosomal protein L37AE/L43A